MKQNNVNKAPDPEQNPFVFLWLANYVIYSVVVAFLVMEGWEKSEQCKKTMKESPDERMKEIHEAQAGEKRTYI